MPVLAPSERRSSRGISLVVGVSFPAVIVVLPAAIVGMVVMRFEGVLSEPQPQVLFNVDYRPDDVGNDVNGACINITHKFSNLEDGNRVLVVDDTNNRVAWGDVWTGDETVGSMGEYAHIDGAGSDSALKPICEAGQHYRVVIKHEDGSSGILADYETPTEPISKSAAC